MGKIVKAADKGIKGFKRIFIDDPRRAWTIGIFLVIVIVLIAVFWKSIKAFFTGLAGKAEDNAELANHIAQTGESVNLSASELSTMVNQLYTAMKGPGTDEETIYAVFKKCKNKADVLKLIAKFGTKDDKDLPTWIRSELSDTWPFKDLTKLNNILSDKGIDYSF